MGSERRSRRNMKNPNGPKATRMIDNCRNLLLINTDHPYAAPMQGRRCRRKKNKKDVSESESDAEMTCHNEELNKADNAEECVVSIQAVESEADNKSNKDDKNEVKAETNIPKNANKESKVVESAVNVVENINNRVCIESIFLKEEIIEDTEDVNLQVTNNIIKTEINDESGSCSKTVMTNANHINKGNLPEICILCATTNMSKKSYTLIIHFAEMIKDLSGVEILNSNVSPIACNICLKLILDMWNFKQQIISANKFIKEKIPKNFGISLISTFNSRNVPKPVPFQYINYKDQDLNTSNEKCIEKDMKMRKMKKRSSKREVTSTKPSKIDEVTLVPIENILNDGLNYFIKNCITLKKCTTCGTIEDDNVKSCKCRKKKVLQNFTCSICGKQFLSWRSLSVHEIVHKAKCYKCGICKKAFYLKSYLKRHLGRHSTKKQFLSPSGNKRLGTKRNLL